MKIETNKINSCAFRLPIRASVLLGICGALCASIAQAAITIDTVLVGDAGNAADTTGFGAVNYNYNIGTYEVTNSQYAAFLNAVAATDTYNGLYNYNGMNSNANGGILRFGGNGSYTYQAKSGRENEPVNYVDIWSAMRFANWLTNGQPTGAQDNGTTESGAYTLTASGISNNTVARGSWFDPSSGNTSTQTIFAVASQDEWYKAAYYDGNGGYTSFATQSNTDPTSVLPGDASGSNNANYAGAGRYDDDGNRIDQDGPVNVGSYVNSASYYGTYDQTGNVYERTDTISGSGHIVRGGNWSSLPVNVNSGSSLVYDPARDNSGVGFRITTFTAVPEPSTYAAIFGVLGLGIALIYRRRRN